MTFGTLVDSNVLLDILTNDQTWSEWSLEALALTADTGPLYINPVIYAEVSIGFSTVEAIEDALPSGDYRREPLPWAAAFLAGKALLDHPDIRYRYPPRRQKLSLVIQTKNSV